MNLKERIRQAVPGKLSTEEVQRMQGEGWTLVALEWEREIPPERKPSEVRLQEEPPYGMRVAEKTAALEEDPTETDVLFSMMELIVEDGPYSRIASELNQKGFRTREGEPWTPTAVFEMLPRLIDVGPAIFSTAEWERRRRESRQR